MPWILSGIAAVALVMVMNNTVSTNATKVTYEIPSSAVKANCDPAYPDEDVCIPPPPPDLDCKDIEYTNFTVVEPDPHRFDGDDDGVGCESY